jgi:FKBP-type peptidyl-prolyl cis-trans isomerase FkpA/FKBP-type peptidyl-prolyl cis-trans isomerase FklB
MNLRLTTLAAISAASAFMATAQDKTPPPAAPPGAAELTAPKFAPDVDPLSTVDMGKVSYIIGRNIVKQMAGQGFTPNYDSLKDGMKDGVEKKDSKITDAEQKDVMEKFSAAMQEIDKRKQAEAGKKGEQFLADNGKKKGVTTTASGLQYEVLKAAEGPKPAATDTVKVHYKGTLINGEEFDSSYARNEPATFPLNGVIPGWTEGVQLMNKGSKFKFVIPGKLAYGEQGSPPKIGPNETLVFEVELLDIIAK